jgi:hypothetical protein
MIVVIVGFKAIRVVRRIFERVFDAIDPMTQAVYLLPILGIFGDPDIEVTIVTP